MFNAFSSTLSFRSRLLLYFLFLSTLTIVVGIIFYSQLISLITPLNQNSIPKRVEQLIFQLENNEFISRLVRRQMIMQRDLEFYVFTQDYNSLQNYYLNKSKFKFLLNQTKKFDIKFSNKVSNIFETLDSEYVKIIDAMRGGDVERAKSILKSKEYLKIIKDINSQFEAYYQQINRVLNEEATVSVKLAAKNSELSLQNSLNTTLILFLNALLISFVFAFISARAISKPLNILRDNIENMNKGNLEIPITSKLLHLKGDLGDLARAFSNLINILRATTVKRDELIIEIEQRKKFEYTLKQTAQRLKETNRDLDQFAYIASHDLKAPLRAIESLVTWIKEDCYNILPEQSRHNFDLIKKRAQRLESLIDGILEYSRAGKVTTRDDKIDLGDIIFEIVENLSVPAHIQIILDTPMPAFYTHKTSITQVFLNLISNAIKYHDKSEGHIHIGCTEFENYYQFYVADDGPGIEKEFFDKIFELFQTLQSRDEVEGAGIGLSIVKKIIEQQGGKIWIESQLHKGTTFYFTWMRSLENK